MLYRAVAVKQWTDRGSKLQSSVATNLIIDLVLDTARLAQFPCVYILQIGVSTQPIIALWLPTKSKQTIFFVSVDYVGPELEIENCVNRFRKYANYQINRLKTRKI